MDSPVHSFSKATGLLYAGDAFLYTNRESFLERFLSSKGVIPAVKKRQ